MYEERQAELRSLLDSYTEWLVLVFKSNGLTLEETTREVMSDPQRAVILDSIIQAEMNRLEIDPITF